MLVDYVAIGQRIRSVRKQKGHTQEKLAEKLGVSIVYVSQIENGKTKINLEMLLHISHIFNVEPGYFITGVSYDPEHHTDNEIAALLESYPPEKKETAN